MWKKIKIGPKLILVGTVIVLAPLVVVALLTVTQASRALTEVMQEQMANRANEYAQMIDSVFLAEQKMAVEVSVGNATIAGALAVAEKGINGSQAPIKSLNQKLARFLATEGLGDGYQAIYVAGTDGIIFSASSAEFYGISLADEMYFTKQAIAGKVSAGDVGANKVTGRPFVPMASSIRSSSGTIVGVVANVIDITSLTDMIGKAKLGKTGYVFVVDRHGLVIAHPVRENILSLDITTVNGMETFTPRMLSGESGVDVYVYQGIAKTAAFAPSTITGWRVALAIPNDEFLTSANAIRNLILIIAGVSFLLAVILFFLFARTISKPLGSAVSFISVIAGGDLLQNVDESLLMRSDELGTLGRAMEQ
jgi:methyl-accepting chemotaxis protein